MLTRRESICLSLLGTRVGVNGLHRSLVAKVKELCAFASEAEATQVLSGMRWIGLFSNDPAPVRSGNLLDTLCARLEHIMAFEPGERDLVLLQHKFVVEWPNGEEVR